MIPDKTAPRLQRVVQQLGEVSRLWLNPKHPLRREALSALQVSTGLKTSQIEQAWAAAFGELSEEKLYAYTSQTTAFALGHLAPKSVLHILAGNVFTSWLPGAYTTLLLGARCVLKPSTQELTFPALWKRSVAEVSWDLSDQIDIVSWNHWLLQEHSTVVAYGSDETLAKLKAQMTPGMRFIGYGHKISAAVIWQDALEDLYLPAQLQADIEPFNLQGCLSPQVVYVQGGDFSSFKVLDSKVTQMPTFKAFHSWDDLKPKLTTLKPYLSTLGVAGRKPEEIPAADRIDLGITRVCPLGEMQCPPISWPNGGFLLAEKLIQPS